MRILTAGESHGLGMVAILEGFPQGVKIEESFINQELARRMSGVGRGARMSLEKDKAEIICGLRNKLTLGSPIAVLVKNKDVKIFSQSGDNLPSLFTPRPAHADLGGAFKYQEKDLRNILERASARETVCRVGIGAICKQFLLNFNIKIASFTMSVGDIISKRKPENIQEITNKVKTSKLNCIDRGKEKLMIREIKKVLKAKDSLGGVLEVWAEGLLPGLGSFMHFDKRLDAKLACYLMSIPAVRGFELGLGFEYARKRGSASHDAIYHSGKEGFKRKTNNSGGIEAGVSTGSPIVLRIAMKPIATLGKPLDSVNLTTYTREKAPIIRSDICAIFACGVIAENMTAIALTESFLEKFGCDTLKEIKANYQNYRKTIGKL